MKKSWWKKKFGSSFSLKCKCLFAPLLFVATVVVVVSYFAASYVIAAERAAKRSLGMSDVHVISTGELKEAMETDDVVVINVLDERAYRKSHIPDSINIPVRSGERFEKEMSKYKNNTPIVVHCASSMCPLSGQAYRILTEKLGFTNVRDYKDGIEGWKAAGYELDEGSE